MAAICTPTPGGKPAPGFTFGIARPLLCPDYVPRVNWLEGRPTRTGKGGSGGVAQPIAALEKLPSSEVIVSMRICQRCFH